MDQVTKLRRLLPLCAATLGAAAAFGCDASGSDPGASEVRRGGPGGDPSGGGDPADAGAPTGDAARDGAADGSRPDSAGSLGTGGALGPSVALPGCAGCLVHVPPSYAQGHATPLVVALHGDEGPASGVPSVISLWTAAADAHGYIVLALPCGADLGCADGNWSGWLAGQGYQITPAHMAWMNAQATMVESLYDVDPKREYLTGYSGGAYVMGYFAQAQAARYGAVAFVAGGMPAWTGTGHACPQPAIPGYFLGGDGDYRTGGQMSDTAQSFAACKEEYTLDVVTGADHGATIASLGTGRADVILGWFEQRPLR
jgi:polyhydroxybutyrate depolymerase